MRKRKRGKKYHTPPIGSAAERVKRCRCAECSLEDDYEKWGYWQMRLL